MCKLKKESTACDSTTKKILIVDDSEVFRRGLKCFLSMDDRIQIVGECEDFSELLPFLLRKEEIDVVLLDYRLSSARMGSKEIAYLLSTSYQPIKIVMLSVCDPFIYQKKFSKYGITSFLNKYDASLEDIRKAIDVG